jgi:hypothetical protein
MGKTFAIIGPPGTGKTYEVENLIQKHGTKSYLYLTYNRNMAEKARERIRDDSSMIATLHSAMARINGITEFMKIDDIKNFCKLMGLTYPLNGQINIDTGETDWERFNRYYDTVINSLIKPYQPVNEKLNMPYLFDKYEEFKEKYLKFDYTDILKEGATHRYYRECLYVDEAQDMTALMWKIIDQIDSEEKYIVGDPHQSIYGFRGVNVNDFKAHLNSYKVLSQSHRYGDNLRALSQRALSFGKVIDMDYRGLGETKIDTYTLDSMAKLSGTKAILCRTQNLAKYIANNLPYAVIPINPEHSYGNGWTSTTFRIGKIMRKWYSNSLTLEEIKYIMSHSPANLWIRGTKTKVLKDPSIFSYGMIQTKLSSAEIINRLDIQENVKTNAKRLLREDLPVIYCDTIHASKGLEFDHVMLVMDLPLREADNMTPEEYRILYVGLTRAKKSIQFINLGYYKGTYHIPTVSKSISPLTA